MRPGRNPRPGSPVYDKSAQGEAMRFVTRKRPGPVLFGLAVVAAVAATAAVPASASAAAQASPVVGHVYVNDNTAGTNTIGAFDRHADGTLTPEAGSPFAAGGAGTGSGLASQGALQFSADGRFLIAVDAGSNQISVLRSIPMVPSAWCPAVWSPPAACCPTASRSTVTWCTWPTPGPGTATTPASGSASAATCSTFPGRPCCWPPAPRPVRCCSTAPAPS